MTAARAVRMGLGIALGLGMAAALRGQFVLPIYYSATPADTTHGSWPYGDETEGQLADGVVGVDDWSADLGHGPAYEWVGWSSPYTPNPNVTFYFSGRPTIRTVYIGFNRREDYGAVFLPASVSIGGATFSLSGTEIANGTRGDLAFSGLWAGDVLPIDLTHANLWMMVDEFRFSTEAIPEPWTASLAPALLAAAGLLWRRRRGVPGASV